MKTVVISISLNLKTLKEVDRTRGLISRSAWIEDILKKNLKEGVTQR